MTRPTDEPFALHLTVQVLVSRSDDPRPVVHTLGRLRLTDADRLHWRSRIAELLTDVATTVGSLGAASLDARYSLPVDPPIQEGS